MNCIFKKVEKILSNQFECRTLKSPFSLAKTLKKGMKNLIKREEKAKNHINNCLHYEKRTFLGVKKYFFNKITENFKKIA